MFEKKSPYTKEQTAHFSQPMRFIADHAIWVGDALALLIVVAIVTVILAVH